MVRSSVAQILLALVCLVMPLAVSAVTINVTTRVDEYGSGANCSLREAIEASIAKAAFGGTRSLPIGGALHPLAAWPECTPIMLPEHAISSRSRSSWTRRVPSAILPMHRGQHGCSL